MNPLDLKQSLYVALGADEKGWFHRTAEEVLGINANLFASASLSGAYGESLLFEWSPPSWAAPDCPDVYTLSVHRQFFVETLPDGSECPEPDTCWSVGAWLQFSASNIESPSGPSSVRCEDTREIVRFIEIVRNHPIFYRLADVSPVKARAFMVVASTFDPEVLLREARLIYL